MKRKGQGSTPRAEYRWTISLAACADLHQKGQISPEKQATLLFCLVSLTRYRCGVLPIFAPPPPRSASLSGPSANACAVVHCTACSEYVVSGADCGGTLPQVPRCLRSRCNHIATLCKRITSEPRGKKYQKNYRAWLGKITKKEQRGYIYGNLTAKQGTAPVSSMSLSFLFL